jgi:ABC-type branched-subunit amino acid transport system substrate-binding protein
MIQGKAWLAAVTIYLCLLVGMGLTPEQHRGKQIFLSGTSTRGEEITARIGADNSSVPAAILPCASCHGRDGRGHPEGGISPSNIAWDVLTKPYAVTSAAGRQRSPYTETLLKRAIVMGVDSSGNPLQTTMPRFQMKLTDLDDLVAYLHILGAETDPGITDSELRLGVVLAAGPWFAETRAAVRFVLEAWQRDINARGGIFGRKLVLRFLEPPENSGARMAAVREFIEHESLFALLASAIAGVDREMAALMSEKEVPVVGAFALYPQIAFPLNRYLFYLQPGIAEQGRALAVFMTEHLGHAPLHAVIVDASDQLTAPVIAAVKAQCSKLDWPAIETVNASTIEAGHWRPAAGEVVLVLAPDIFKKLLELDGHSTQKTQYLIPASLVNFDLSALPGEIRSRMFIAYPALPSDGSPDGLSYYRNLTARSPHAGHHLAAQWTALASARLLTYALENAGRNLSREQLIETLEGIYQYPTGLLPAVSFGPNRRIGSTGAHIVAANHLDQPGQWIEPE